MNMARITAEEKERKYKLIRSLLLQGKSIEAIRAAAQCGQKTVEDVRAKYNIPKKRPGGRVEPTNEMRELFMHYLELKWPKPTAEQLEYAEQHDDDLYNRFTNKTKLHEKVRDSLHALREEQRIEAEHQQLRDKLADDPVFARRMLRSHDKPAEKNKVVNPQPIVCDLNEVRTQENMMLEEKSNEWLNLKDTPRIQSVSHEEDIAARQASIAQALKNHGWDD